jgi:integrase
MRGSIIRRGKNSFRIQIYTDKNSNGKPQRYFETVHATRKKDVEPKLRELLSSMDKGIFTPPGNMTIKDLLQNWLEGYCKNQCSDRTYRGYKSICENHLVHAFGSLKLKELTTIKIEKFYGDSVGKWSARTVHHWHRCLSEALKYGVKKGYLGINPCSLSTAPRARKKTMRTLTPDEVVRLLNAGKDSYYYPPIYFALNTGMRQGEIFALRWRDVDLIYGTISINRSLYKRHGQCLFKEPKTASSRRTNVMTEKLASFMALYKKEREYIYSKTDRVLVNDDLVFTSIGFEPMNPSVITHNFQRIATIAGITDIRYHDLRHTFASLCLLKGVQVKLVSEALGHSSSAFTADTYQHIIQGMQEDAMRLLNDVIPCGALDNFNAKLTPSLHNTRLMPA